MGGSSVRPRGVGLGGVRWGGGRGVWRMWDPMGRGSTVANSRVQGV